jgi:iron complex transport system substrate-binding protein
MSRFPSRIVCLSAEAVETLFRLGCGRQLAGVTAFATHPAAARRLPRVGGFSAASCDRIDALKPDLVITFSDVQAGLTQELVRRGHTVLATNQRSLAEVFDVLSLLGRVVGRAPAAERLVAMMRREIDRPLKPTCRRPKIYFEEWHDPLISGIGWVGELIEAAGGIDLFPELRGSGKAAQRVVAASQVIARAPDIMVASWCGRKVDRQAIARRRGWASIPAVRDGQVYEIPSSDILQPGPGLMRGLRHLRRIVARWNQGINRAR